MKSFQNFSVFYSGYDNSKSEVFLVKLDFWRTYRRLNLPNLVEIDTNGWHLYREVPEFQGRVWVDPCYGIHSKVKFGVVSTQSPNAENLKGFH